MSDLISVVGFVAIVLVALLVGLVWGFISGWNLGHKEGRKKEQVSMARAMGTIRRHYSSPGVVGTSECSPDGCCPECGGAPMNIDPACSGCGYEETPEEEAERETTPDVEPMKAEEMWNALPGPSCSLAEAQEMAEAEEWERDI